MTDPNATIGGITTSTEVLPAATLERSVRLGSELGRGGMAVVREGEQLSLARRVAVKSGRHSKVGDQQRLVAEAQITGRLEHPHIVPVHDVVQGDDGGLHILLKRIEGRPWSDYLADPARVRADFPVDDVQEWHLDVLESVAEALEFAHANGIVHRDLKPANVMVGAFGQVYLVDWGVAAEIDGLATGPRGIVGTPRYMAPELAAGAIEKMGVTTDVYLLGAVLHEVITGHPPHRGLDVRALMAAIPDFVPKLDDPVLQALLTAAMAPEPSDRIPDVPTFMAVLRKVRREKGARQLHAQAHEALVALNHHLQDGDRARIYQSLGAVRFGLEEAARLAPDLAEIDDTLAQAVLSVGDWELSQGEEKAAEAVLAGLSEVPAAMRERIGVIRADKLARAMRMAKLERHVDKNVGAIIRTRVLLVICGAWMVKPLFNLWEAARWGVDAALLLLVGGLVWWKREHLFATRDNTQVIGFVAATVVGNAMMSLGVALGYFDERQMFRANDVLNLALTLTAGILVSSRFLWVSVLIVLIFLLDPSREWQPLFGFGIALAVLIGAQRTFRMTLDGVWAAVGLR